MADNRKRQRSSAKGRLTRYINSLETLLKEEGNNLSEATLLFNDVLKAWDNVEVKHEQYIAALGEAAGVDEEDQWIAAEQRKLDDIRRHFTKYGIAIADKEISDSAIRDRDVQDKLFHEQCESAEAAIAGNLSTDTIMREKHALQKRIDDLEIAHKKVIEMVPHKDERVVIFTASNKG